MKKILLLPGLLLAMFFGAQTANANVVLNATNFPDPIFRACVSQVTGISVGNTIYNLVLERVKEIKVGNMGISSLQGIEYFPELLQLSCYRNQLTSLDVSKNTKLINLDCYSNQLASLDVSKNTELTYLDCFSNQLTSLDVSKNTELTKLECYNNQLTSLDVSKNTELTVLDCYRNQLTSLDVSKNAKLTNLICHHNQLASLDVTKNTKLTQLWCGYNQLTRLDVSKNTELTGLACQENQLTSLDVSENTQLKELYCDNNNISSLYLSNNPELKELDCGYNKIDQLNLSNNTKLDYLYCNNNRLIYLNLDNTSLGNPGNINIYSQSSTRRFQITSNGSCWGLYVGTTDASRIRNLKIDDESKTPSITNGNLLVVSDDLKKIPLKVEYEIYTGQLAAGWMDVTVNYDVKHYKVYIAGEELTSLNFYDIPGLKSGTAYFYDETSGIGWSGYLPTLVLNNAIIEGEEGIRNEECYNLKIIVNGENEVTATDYNAFSNRSAAVWTYFSGGGTLHLTAPGDRWHGIYACDSYITIKDATKITAKGDGYGYFDDNSILYIQDNSILACYGNKYPSVELPVESQFKIGQGIDIHYPVGAYISGHHVYYAGTTTDVQRDWVVIGPDNQATQDFIATGISLTEEGRSQMEDGAIYNLAGQRLSKTQRGINIVGGKKILR